MVISKCVLASAFSEPAPLSNMIHTVFRAGDEMPLMQYLCVRKGSFVGLWVTEHIEKPVQAHTEDPWNPWNKRKVIMKYSLIIWYKNVLDTINV